MTTLLRPGWSALGATVLTAFLTSGCVSGPTMDPGMATADPATTVSGPTATAAGPPVEQAKVDASGTLLSLVMIGSPAPLGKICGEDYPATAVESDTSVVGTVTRWWIVSTSDDRSCAGVGLNRTTRVVLSHPLADRAVIDARTGAVVRVTG